MKIHTIVVALLSVSTLAAQTPSLPTGFEVQVYRAVDSPTGTPFRLYQATAVCGLTPTPPPAGTVVNPSYLEFDDVGAPGKACRITTGTFLAALPVATGYRATITALAPPAPASARSNVAGPFDVAPLAPSVPTGAGFR